jgi:hypothetical protein
MKCVPNSFQWLPDQVVDNHGGGQIQYLRNVAGRLLTTSKIQSSIGPYFFFTEEKQIWNRKSDLR